MTVREAVGGGIRDIVEIGRFTLLWTDEDTGFAFMTERGLCLLGVSDWEEQEGYVDIRWRVLMGEVTETFDVMSAMKANNKYSETPYGIAVLQGKTVLTITDTYRFLISWGPARIKKLIYLRFGGSFLTKFVPEGLRSMPQSWHKELLDSIGFGPLLGIASDANPATGQ
jgi:hypothetical protein